MREQTQVKVFLDEKSKPIHLGGGEDAFDKAKHQLAMRELIEGVTTDGDPIAIPTGAVKSVVGVGSRRKPDPGIMNGRQVRVRSAARLADTEDDVIKRAVPADRLVYTVAVYAEDMAEIVTLVFDLETGDRYWVNPAAVPEALDAQQRGATLLALAETLEVEQYQEQAKADLTRLARTQEIAIDRTMGLSEDQINAKAHLVQKGDVQFAVRIAGPEFVAAFLSESGFSGGTLVLTTDGQRGEITGYDPDTERFELSDPANGIPWEVQLADIQSVLAWDADDRTPTLTEAGREAQPQS